LKLRQLQLDHRHFGVRAMPLVEQLRRRGAFCLYRSDPRVQLSQLGTGRGQ
jgi:hypothetical protein